MANTISCPNCGHVIEVNGCEFDKYERIAAELVGGRIMPERTPGYDVLGPDGARYQVKYSNKAKPDRKTRGIFQWFGFNSHGVKGREPDLYILYGISQGNAFCFLVPPEKVVQHLTPRKHKNDYMLGVAAGQESWIWDFRLVDVSRSGFERRRAELSVYKQQVLW